MNILKPSAFHAPIPNIQLVVNNTSVNYESLASFRISSNTDKSQQPGTPVSLPMLVLVALLHVLAGWQLMQSQQADQPASTSLPMMVTIVQENKIEPVIEPPKPVENKPVENKPIETKPVVKTKPKVVATTQEKAEIQASEQLPQISEPTLPAPAPLTPETQTAEVKEIAPAAKVAVNDAPAKPEPKPVYVAPAVGANYLHNPAPEYPQMARRRGEQGRVLIKVLVTSQGDASNVTLEKSSGSNYLDDAAIKAVKNWKFVPARSNNEPVSGYVTVPINFSLES